MAKTWKQRYAGYARRQAEGIREGLVKEVELLRERDTEEDKVQRAEARLASWDELLRTYDWAKQGPPIEDEEEED